MNVGRLKKILSNFSDDVEIMFDTNGEEAVPIRHKSMSLFYVDDHNVWYDMSWDYEDAGFETDEDYKDFIDKAGIVMLLEFGK